MPPGAQSSVGTPGFLPFFVTLQRGVPGVFSADLTISYTPTELAIAGITPGSPQEAALVIGHFHTGTCMAGGAVCGTFQLPLVPGGGKVATDCRAEWQVVNATNTPFLDDHGFPNRIQTCTDGDPTCDADRTADGTCTFRVSVCLDQTDSNLLVCTAGGTTGYQVRKPVPTSKDPTDAANAAALVNVLTALGGTATGTRHNDVHFPTPLAAPACTGFAAIEVPLKNGRATNKTLRGCGELGKCQDDDRLKLRCLPAS